MADGARGLLTRRRVLVGSVAGGVAVLAGAIELVNAGALPGKTLLDRIDGACDVPGPAETFVSPGPTITGMFFSHARNRPVTYTIAYPPGHMPGSRLPLAIYLYGDGGDHNSPLGGYPLGEALAGHTAAGALPPMALVCADGGSNLYWNPHPGDDPLAMLTDELVPLCRRRGLGLGAGRLGVLGISMGGYGALLLTERRPDLISAVAAISPAVWTSYSQARAVNPVAFASAADFIADDVIAGADRLQGKPVRIASGSDDPLRPGAVALIRRLPRATVYLGPGCHDSAFFGQQQLPSLQFLANHLHTPAAAVQ